MAIDFKQEYQAETFYVSSAWHAKYKFMWTRVKDVSIYLGDWTAHTVVFSKQLHSRSRHRILRLNSRKIDTISFRSRGNS